MHAALTQQQMRRRRWICRIIGCRPRPDVTDPTHCDRCGWRVRWRTMNPGGLR